MYAPWPFGAGTSTEVATDQPTAPEPKAKCKAKAKAKAKSGGGKAVAEVTPKTFEELKSEICATLSPANLHTFPHCDLWFCYFFVVIRLDVWPQIFSNPGLVDLEAMV